MGHQDREAMGVAQSEKFPGQGLRWGEEVGPGFPYLCPPLPTRVSPRVQTLRALVTHSGSPQAGLHA